MKPTTAIKRLVALLEETRKPRDREALSLALRALVDGLKEAEPQGQILSWRYNPTPRWYEGRIGDDSTATWPSQTWTSAGNVH